MESFIWRVLSAGSCCALQFIGDLAEIVAQHLLRSVGWATEKASWPWSESISAKETFFPAAIKASVISRERCGEKRQSLLKATTRKSQLA